MLSLLEIFVGIKWTFDVHMWNVTLHRCNEVIIESKNVKQRVTNWLLAIVVYVGVFFYYSNNQWLKTLWFVYVVSLRSINDEPIYSNKFMWRKCTAKKHLRKQENINKEVDDELKENLNFF